MRFLTGTKPILILLDLVKHPHSSSQVFSKLTLVSFKRLYQSNKRISLYFQRKIVK